MENKELLKLLYVSNEVARRGRPFRCDTRGCPQFGALGSGTQYLQCECYASQLRAHFMAVDLALQGEESGSTCNG